MAIPTRTDGQTMGGPSLRRRPILLARLPRVGGSVAEPESGLALVQEERVAVSLPNETRDASHFVDPGHLQGSAVAPVAVEQAVELGEATLPKTSSARSHKRSHTSHSHHSQRSRTRSRGSTKHASRGSQPTGLAAVYCQIHALIGPYAGAIVALALVASASLMYWMFLSPVQPSLDYQGGVNDGWGITSVEIPPFVPGTTASSISEVGGMATPLREERTRTSGTKSLEVSLQPAQVASLEAPPALLTPALEQALAEVPKEQAVAVAAYPSTPLPTALDFSQVSAAGKGGLLEPPVAMPQVANQSVVQPPAPARR